jgi:hypothetical protein
MNERFKGLTNIKGVYFPTDDDIDKMTECLNDAYKSVDYPLTHYFLKKQYVDDKLLKFWKTTILALKDEALFICDSPDIKGVSVWLMEGFKGNRFLPFVLNGAYNFSIDSWYRMMIYENYSMKLKYKYTKHNSWYFYNVGVRKEFQHSGVFEQMVNPVLEYLDSVKKGCYLETHTEVNNKIYQKLGFELMEIGKVPLSDLNHYALYKKPKIIEEK